MKKGHRSTIALAMAALLAGAVAGQSQANAAEPAPRPAALAPVDVATNLSIPWNAAFLPDGTTLVTERASARILSISPTGQVTVVQQLLQDVAPRGEGGLLGMAVSPTYQTDGLVYIYYTTATDNRISRLRLGERPQPILTGIPAGNIHNGGRIAFGPDGFLYAGTGDAGQTANAQNRNSLGGKILRMTAAGAPAPNNPVPGSRLYSLGHRNVQGFAWDSTGRMYASEFGQNTWDEFNRIQAGANYGWPVVEGRGTDPRFTNPLVTWTTAQASPSGIAIRGNNAYVACLRGQKVFRIALGVDGGVVGQPEALFNGQFGRLRQVTTAPDGSLVVLTSNRDGRGTPRPGDDRVVRLDI